MKKYKILHIPTALYVWESEYTSLGDVVEILNDSKRAYTIFLCHKNILKKYLAEQKCMGIADYEDSVLLYNLDYDLNPVKPHEFEIMEVTDEEV